MIGEMKWLIVLLIQRLQDFQNFESFTFFLFMSSLRSIYNDSCLSTGPIKVLRMQFCSLPSFLGIKKNDEYAWVFFDPWNGIFHFLFWFFLFEMNAKHEGQQIRILLKSKPDYFIKRQKKDAYQELIKINSLLCHLYTTTWFC